MMFSEIAEIYKLNYKKGHEYLDLVTFRLSLNFSKWFHPEFYPRAFAMVICHVVFIVNVVTGLHFML